MPLPLGHTTWASVELDKRGGIFWETVTNMPDNYHVKKLPEGTNMLAATVSATGAHIEYRCFRLVYSPTCQRQTLLTPTERAAVDPVGPAVALVELSHPEDLLHFELAGTVNRTVAHC